MATTTHDREMTHASTVRHQPVAIAVAPARDPLAASRGILLGLLGGVAGWGVAAWAAVRIGGYFF